MRTSLHRIITEDRLELVGLLYEPESETSSVKKVLVHVHGMAGNFYENKFLDAIAKTLTDNGISFVTFNNRGCEFVKDLIQVTDVENDGKITQKISIKRIGDTYEKFEDCRMDIKAFIDFAEKKGFSEIHLSGHSLAGPKTAYYITETGDTRVSSVLFISPADMVGLAKADINFERDITTAQKMIAEGRGEEIMPFILWGDSYLSANTFMSLGDDASKVNIFNLYNKKSSLPVLAQISIPTITIMGRKDNALTVSIDELINRVKGALINSSKVEGVILGDAGHGYSNYEQPLADEILRWMKS